MPAIAAHYRFGQEVLGLLPDSIRTFIEEHRPAFDLGLQGPDLLFYYKVWKKNEVVELGHEIHWRTAASFMTSALKNLKQGPASPEAEAYLMGFACHFVLDSTFHGRISELARSEKDHRLLEQELDRQVMETCSCGRHEFVNTGGSDLGWLTLLYPGVSLKTLKRCAFNMMRLTALLDSRNPLIKGLIWISEKALNKGGSFSSMSLKGYPDKKYYSPAREIYDGMNSAAASGAEAVKSVYFSLKEGMDLQSSFEKNFL
jgi:hypothetical protein